MTILYKAQIELNDVMQPNEFTSQIQLASIRNGKKRREILNELEQQVHSLLLLTAQKQFNNMRPDDVAYIMTYVQWLSRELQKKRGQDRASAAAQLGDAYSLIFKLKQAEAHFARRIRGILNDKIKEYINGL